MTLTFKVLTGVAMILIAAFSVVTSTGASTDPQIIHVSLTDTQMRISQFVVTADRPVRFEVANEGTVAHSLSVLPMTAPVSDPRNSLVIGAHTIQVINQTLPAGIYRIYCNFFDHADKGMQSAIAAETTSRTVYPFPMTGLVSILGLALGCAYIIGDSLGLRLIRRIK